MVLHSQNSNKIYGENRMISSLLIIETPFCNFFLIVTIPKISSDIYNLVYVIPGVKRSH